MLWSNLLRNRQRFLEASANPLRKIVTERPDKGERQEKPERTDKAEKPERTDKPGGTDKNIKKDSVENTDENQPKETETV